MRKNLFLIVLACLIFSNDETFAGLRFGNKDSAVSMLGDACLHLNAPVINYTGTLKTCGASITHITGQNISFNNGVLNFADNTDIAFTGSYTITTDNTLVLQDGAHLHASSNNTIPNKIKIPAGATVTISGSLLLQQPIELEDYTAVLCLALKSNLSQNIHLNGGTIILQDDLLMNSNTKILGGGTIDINHKQFKSPGGDFADQEINYLNACDVTLNSNTTYTTNQSFNGSTADFVGCGFMTTFAANNGRFTLGNNMSLCAVNTIFRGVGTSATAGVFSMPKTSTMALQFCTLDLAGTYTHSAGTLVFRDHCNINTHGYKFYVTGGWVIIDGATLEYNNLDGTDDNPFIFSNQSTQLILTNDGNIRSTINRGVYNVSAAIGYLFENYNLGTATPINILNGSPTMCPQIPKNITLDGCGFAINFPSTGVNLFNLSAYANLTLTNVVLNNFNKDVFSYAAGASIAFGTNTQIRLFADTTISAADKAWAFTGNSEIIGANSTLVLNGSSRITLNNSSTLTFKNLNIILKNVDALTMLNATSTMLFENCTISLEAAGCTVSTGNLSFQGLVNVKGSSITAQDVSPVFTFASTGTMQVLSQSLLRFGKNVEFKYMANPANDLGIAAQTKRHLKLVDPSATLELNGCILHSTTTGLALDYGKLWITDASNIQVDGSNGTEMELGSALEVYVGPAVSVNVTGTISYNATTFP